MAIVSMRYAVSDNIDELAAEEDGNGGADEARDRE